jgi:hypothetical protein
MATARLYPDQSRVVRVSGPNDVRHQKDITCAKCGHNYALVYEKAFTKRRPEIQNDLLNRFQEMVTSAHATDHSQPYILVGTVA